MTSEVYRPIIPVASSCMFSIPHQTPNAAKNEKVRRPGIEPGSTAWKAAMLTIIPPTLRQIVIDIKLDRSTV